MILVLLIIAQLNVNDYGYTGLPSNAALLGAAGCGVANVIDPVFYNPAYCAVNPYQGIYFSVVNYQRKQENIFSYPYPALSDITGKFINSATLYSRNTAVFWRILEFNEVDSLVNDYTHHFNIRADEFGLGYAIRDADFYNFMIGFNIKYIHISTDHLYYPRQNNINPSDIIHDKTSSHGIYTDLGLGYKFNIITLGISSRNLWGKIFSADYSLPPVYLGGVNIHNKYFSGGYQFQYRDKFYQYSHHYYLGFQYYNFAVNLGRIDEKDNITYTSGISWKYHPAFVSLAFWSEEVSFNEDYRVYLTLGFKFGK
ncbi:MAG: hypothetical protein ACP5FK_01645 [bacterium]